MTLQRPQSIVPIVSQDSHYSIAGYRARDSSQDHSKRQPVLRAYHSLDCFDELPRSVGPLGSQIAAVAGLRWKIWIMNEAGGIMLFDDEASLEAYLDGPIVAQIVSHPALSDFSVKQFDVMEAETAITRGPV